MICSQNAFKTANFGTKGHFLCTGRRELSLEHVSRAQLCDLPEHMKQIGSLFRMKLVQGQNFSCKSCVSVKKNSLTFNFDRKFSTSSRCLTVTIDNKKNYYHILGVTPSCSGIKIKQAYYRLSKVYHPDVNKSKVAVAKFHEITEAYEVLSNPSLKHSYDSGRRGHSHGLHRGVAQPHPVNFKARGPHQYRTTDKFNYEKWMKEHYTESFKRTIYEINMQRMQKEEEEKEREYKEKNSYARTEVTILDLSVIAIFCAVFVSAVYFLVFKGR